MVPPAQGWPFLVARGRRRGYRTILAPAFLTERRLHGVLADSADGAQLNSGRARHVELNRPDVGRLTLVYRTEQVAAAEVDPGGEGVATDQHGRPLEILYGVVCSGRLQGSVEDADFGMARSEAIESYRRFLTDEDAFGVAASQPFPLRDVGVAEDAEPPPSPSPPPDPAPRGVPVRGAAAFATVGLAVVLAVMLLLLRGGTPDVRLQASATPSAGAFDCASPTTVELAGAVTMKDGGDVVYHWETDGWRSASGRLAFEHGGTRRLPIEHHLTATVPAAGYTLVLEAPQRKRVRAADHALRCPAPAAVDDTALRLPTG